MRTSFDEGGLGGHREQAVRETRRAKEKRQTERRESGAVPSPHHASMTTRGQGPGGQGARGFHQGAGAGIAVVGKRAVKAATGQI